MKRAGGKGPWIESRRGAGATLIGITLCVGRVSMSNYGIDELASFEWMQSRIPALDALVHFVPDGPRDADVDAFASSHRSRWYPLRGGTRVVVSMEREPEYDAMKWKIEQGAWDHEHCDVCGESIPAMTLCWVTKYDPYVLLCHKCHSNVAVSGGA